MLKKACFSFFICVLFLSSCSFNFNDVEVTIVNNSDDTVSIFNAKLSNSDDWGNDLLYPSFLSPSSSKTIYIPSGIYDFQAQFLNNGNTYLNDINLNDVAIYKITIE